MSPAVLAVAGLFSAVYLFILYLALRRPLLAKLAFREAVRRRGQSLLVVGGLMIGAAGITASLVGADSSRDSAVLNAYRTWGMTDLTVTANGSFFSPDVAAVVSEDPVLSPLLDGV